MIVIAWWPFGTFAEKPLDLRRAATNDPFDDELTPARSSRPRPRSSASDAFGDRVRRQDAPRDGLVEIRPLLSACAAVVPFEMSLFATSTSTCCTFFSARVSALWAYSYDRYAAAPANTTAAIATSTRQFLTRFPLPRPGDQLPDSLALIDR